jgi:hypothetical protein
MPEMNRRSPTRAAKGQRRRFDAGRGREVLDGHGSPRLWKADSRIGPDIRRIIVHLEAFKTANKLG